MFAHILYDQTVLFDALICLIRCYHSAPEWTSEQRKWRITPHSLKLRTGALPSDCFLSYPGHLLQSCGQCILQPQLTGQNEIMRVCVCEFVCVCVCVCVKERDKEREFVYVWERMRACVCVRECVYVQEKVFLRALVGAGQSVSERNT